MGPTAAQITSLTIVYSIVYSGTDQRKHQSSASLAFVFPFDDVIMNTVCLKPPYTILYQKCYLKYIFFLGGGVGVVGGGWGYAPSKSALVDDDNSVLVQVMAYQLQLTLPELMLFGVRYVLWRNRELTRDFADLLSVNQNNQRLVNLDAHAQGTTLINWVISCFRCRVRC